MLLMAMIAVGLLSLSTTVLRTAGSDRDQQLARANARLALSIAIGELQTLLGPDERVCAPSSLYEDDGPIAQPNWVAVWSTRREDGSSFWARDDAEGGLRDLRAEDEWEREDAALSYLVSGNEGGRAAQGPRLYEPFQAEGEDGSWVELVGAGTLGNSAPARDRVSVPRISVGGEGALEGTYGYWVGDLGARANVATPNAWADADTREERGPAADGYGILLGQESDASAMTSQAGSAIAPLSASVRERLVTDGQLGLLDDAGWAASLWHDLTTVSQGVLADTRDGGLRKNLTVFLQDDTLNSRADEGGVPSLSTSDRLVGPRNKEHAEALGQDWEAGRHRASAPTFGILRDWVRSAPSYAATGDDFRNPETAFVDSKAAGSRSAFANDEAVQLKSRQNADLMPVLVEGSAFSTFSYHPNPRGFAKPFNIRSHTWPRVVLWNPYNVEITVPGTVVMMQLNSRNDFRTNISDPRFPGFPSRTAYWVSWGGGTRTEPPRSGEAIIASDNYNDPYSGMVYYYLPPEKIGPGECYVYSTEEAGEYDGRNVLNNRLSPRVAPDVARNFYVSSSEFDDDDTGSGFFFQIQDFAYFPFPARLFGMASRDVDNQADDSRMIWKNVEGATSLSIFEFDALPQLQSVSCSLQLGAGKEPRVAWSESNPVPVEFTTLFNPLLTNPPDTRSREGFRMRWLEEHPSNTGVLNNKAGRRIFETAMLANWNPRAAYAIRSPWENVGGDVGDGKASGPWFFGAYTRDLYDQSVGWDEQLPPFEDGFYRGNPFGPPQEGNLRNVLFDLPRQEEGVLSLAQFQHAKLSEFVWHPSYAVGNSLADPRLEVEGLAGTAPILSGETDGGWNSRAIGYSNDSQRSADRDEWARFARFIMQDLPTDETLVYDLSYELNHALWDEFFLSTGSSEERVRFVSDGAPLPNGRMRLARNSTADDLLSVEDSASALLLDGAFNVNSTSVEAWKALLSATRQQALGQEGFAPFSRSARPAGGEWWAGNGDAEDEEAWAGFRSLSEDEVALLAEKIVDQVRLRGPFLSLSDFVNRRLRNDFADEQTGLMGPLQAAIEQAGLNLAFQTRWELEKDREVPDYRHPDNILDATRLDHLLKPDSKAWGVPGYLTQADLLQVIGPNLSARSDTFVIRTYGDALDSAGRVKARAWCEAVVQRNPEPLVPDASGRNPDPAQPGGEFGRRFTIKCLRWLNESEV